MSGERRLTGQDAQGWSWMSEGHLAAASQMVWQNKDVVQENMALYNKVSSMELSEGDWRNKVTWGSSVLLSMATECALKAVSIHVTKDGSCRKTHDLRILWDDVEDSKDEIRRELRVLRERVAGTRLAMVSLGSVDEIIDVHRYTFEMGRYYNESDPNNQNSDLIYNIDLWQLALATVITARRICGGQAMVKTQVRGG